MNICKNEFLENLKFMLSKDFDMFEHVDASGKYVSVGFNVECNNFAENPLHSFMNKVENIIKGTQLVKTIISDHKSDCDSLNAQILQLKDKIDELEKYRTHYELAYVMQHGRSEDMGQ